MKQLKSIQELQHQHQEKFLIAMSLMHDARTDTQIDNAYKEVCKAAVEYSRYLKKLMKNVYEMCCSDQSQIMRFMNDHFNMDPEKCSVDFDIRAYTIYWTISMYHNKERYYYISQLGRPIDMDNFYDWAMKMMT